MTGAPVFTLNDLGDQLTFSALQWILPCTTTLPFQLQIQTSELIFKIGASRFLMLKFKE